MGLPLDRDHSALRVCGGESQSGDEKSGNKYSENFRRAETGKVEGLTGIVVHDSLS